MSKNEFDIDKAYVSPYDKFLAAFDRNHEPSPSQLKEINTYKRINALRDGKELPQAESELWENF